MGRLSRYTALLVCGTMLTACMVGPDYTAPKTDLPATWLKPVAGTTQAQQQWWKDFNDPALDALVERALAGNQDVKIAADRVAEVRGLRESAEGKLYPEIGGAAEAGKSNPGVMTRGGEYSSFQTAFDAAWEIDLFGGNRRAVEAQDALLGGREAALRNAKLTLVAELVREYTELRQLQAQARLAHDTADTQAHLKRIADDRYQHGMASALDSVQAETLLQTTRSHIPDLEKRIQATGYRLSVLLGEHPGSVDALVHTAHAIPQLHALPILDAPAETLRRRPDVAEAERQLAAATALQGVAISALYPRISLLGMFGIQRAQAHVLGYSATDAVWSAGASITMPILEFGTLEGQIKAADARQQQALHQYEKTVVRALADVETSLSNIKNQAEQLRRLSVANDSSRKAIALAKDRYTRGLSDFTTVLQAEQQDFTVQNERIVAQADLTKHAIALQKALANGVEAETPAL